MPPLNLVRQPSAQAQQRDERNHKDHIHQVVLQNLLLYADWEQAQDALLPPLTLIPLLLGDELVHDLQDRCDELEAITRRLLRSEIMHGIALVWSLSRFARALSYLLVLFGDFR